MKPRNLLAVYQGDAAVDNTDADVDKRFKVLKTHEIRNLKSFCTIMQENGCSIANLDGFFVGYTIAQIGKEFDLLRFGRDYVLNIEIKSELKVAKKEQKILKQMCQNHYYLNYLDLPICIFTYVENDGFYQYIEDGSMKKISAGSIAYYVCNQDVDTSIDPDNLFVPSNYLVSPFNSTDSFIKGNYFLTPQQEKIKDEIFTELEEHPLMFICLSASAGTGKTLLMYDIAKSLIAIKKRVLIIHCGILNQGHLILKKDCGWDIIPISKVSDEKASIAIKEYDYIFIDEAQRIRKKQLSALIDQAIDSNLPLFFSFDTKQFLRSGETLNVAEYLKEHYSSVLLSEKKLTNKIRTNKDMASFVINLFKRGKSNSDLNYDSITIDYFEEIETVKEYILFLSKTGWTAVTYTTSQYDYEPYDIFSEFIDLNAHNVIGQEFSKVVLVMDKNFNYNDNGKLEASNSYYSALGMLYQIVTRVVDELKIIVLDNPKLYIDLLKIKSMSI